MDKSKLLFFMLFFISSKFLFAYFKSMPCDFSKTNYFLQKASRNAGMLAKLAEMLLAFTIDSLCIYANNCDIVSDPKTKKHYQDNLL